jgi:hypothetical protein
MAPSRRRTVKRLRYKREERSSPWDRPIHPAVTSCHPVVVSKAFTREEEAGLPVIVPPRAPLPEGVPNYVTANGLAQLREELAKLGAEQEWAGRDLEDMARTQALAGLTARRGELERRIVTAELVVPPARGPSTRFASEPRLRSGAKWACGSIRSSESTRRMPRAGRSLSCRRWRARCWGVRSARSSNYARRAA